MKRELIRKRSGISTAIALLMVLMMTAVMTLAGTFAVFADDTVPDQELMTGKIRDVSKKQEITFRGEGPNNGPPPAPVLPGHVPNGDQDADPDDISGTDDSPGSPNLSDFGDDGGIGNMPELGGGNDNNDNNNNHEIDNTSGDGSGPGPSEDDQLSSGPPEEEGKELSGPEKDIQNDPEKDIVNDIPKDKTGDPEKDVLTDPEKDIMTDFPNDKTGDPENTVPADIARNQPETNDNAVIRVADKTSGTSEDNGKDKSGTDKTMVSGSTSNSAASTGSAGTGSPKTGDDSGLADTMTMLILSMACLAAMTHSRRNRTTDRRDH